MPYPPDGFNMYCRKATSVANMHSLLSRLWNEEDGQDMIEYALLAAFLAVAVGAISPSVATDICTMFSRVATVLTAANATGG